MLPIRIKIAKRAFPSKRAFTRASKVAHHEMGEHYHKQLIPKHFRPGAEAEYHYRRRKEPGYKTPGIDRHGNRKSGIVERLVKQGKALPEATRTPLVVTGALRRAVTQLAVVRSFPSRATVQMTAPVYAPMRPRTTKNPPIGLEATRVSGKERGILAKVLADAMDREQAKENAKEKETINL